MLSVELTSRYSCYVFYRVFHRETSKMSARQFRHTFCSNNQPRPQVSSVNGSNDNLLKLTSSVQFDSSAAGYGEFNMRVVLPNQKRGNILNE